VGEIRQFFKLANEGQSLMQAAMTQLNLSARAYQWRERYQHGKDKKPDISLLKSPHN
jgi:predicted ATPase with chaperone activity